MGDAHSSGLELLFNTLTKHVHHSHSEYLVKWLELLALEEADLDKSRIEIWSMTSQERESLGR